MSGRGSLPEAGRIGLLALSLCTVGYFANPLLDADYFAQLWSDPDIAWQSFPGKALARRALLSGELPLYNPHILGGMPQAGNPQAQVFYPGTVLFLPGVRFGLGAALFVHAVLAFAGAYLLARQELPDDASRTPAALMASIVYTFSGSMATQIQQTAISHTSAWLPIFFWGILSGRPSRAAVVTAGLVLAGHTQIATYALLLGIVLLALRAAVPTGEPGRIGRAIRGATGVAWGIGLSAVLLLPAAELLGISMRGKGVTAGFAEQNAFQEWHFPLLVSPAAYASQHADSYFTYAFVGSGTLLLLLLALLPRDRARLPRAIWAFLVVLLIARPALSFFISTTKGIPAMGGFYITHWDLLVTLSKGQTLTTVLLPLAALVSLIALGPTRTLAQGWGIALFLSLGLALGPSAPVLGALFRLPVLGDARGTVRFFHLYALAAAVLAAHAVHRALSWAGRLARASTILPVFFVAALALTSWRTDWISMPFALGASLTLTWLLLLGLRRAEPGGSVAPLARFVPHAIALTELLLLGTDASRVTDPRLYRYGDPDRVIPGRDPAARVLVLRDGDLSCFETAFNPNAGMAMGYDGALGYEPLALRSATELVGVASPMATYATPGGKLAELRDMAQVAVPELVGPRSFAILRLLRARYLVTKGMDLLSEVHALPLQRTGAPPNRQSWDRARESYQLSAGSEAVFQLQAPGRAAELRFALAADPRLAERALPWPGADVEMTIRAGDRILKRQTLPIDPPALGSSLSFRSQLLPMPEAHPGEELNIVFKAIARSGIAAGFEWVTLTRPVVLTRDPEHASLLASRLRPIATAGMSTSCGGSGVAAAAGPAAVRIYELPDALPLCVAPRRVEGGDPWSRLGDPSFDPTTSLILPGQPAAELPACRVLSASGSRADVSVTYDATGPTWLLLTNAFVPGLTANVDGDPAEVLRADGHFVACAVPAGRHELHVRYRPLSVRLGLFVSLGSMMGWSVCIGGRRRR